MDDTLARLERYFDTVLRAFMDVEDRGPVTLFLRRGGQGHHGYARPRLDHDALPIRAEDLRSALARLRELGAPESLEWVHETTPGLLDTAREVGLEVEELALLILVEHVPAAVPEGVRVAVLDPEDPLVEHVQAAVGAAFADTDELAWPGSTSHVRERMAAGLLRVVGAFGTDGDPEPLGGGSHSPRDGVTELTGIGVVPRARGAGVGAAVTAALVADARALGVSTACLSAGSERVAGVYRRCGFATLGTAFVAERRGQLRARR